MGERYRATNESDEFGSKFGAVVLINTKSVIPCRSNNWVAFHNLVGFIKIESEADDTSKITLQIC